MFPPHAQTKAREDHELHRTCRGGDQEAQVVKRRRKQLVKRQVQTQLPWATTQQTQERMHAIDREETNAQGSDPTLPTLEPPADEDSDLDDPEIWLRKKVTHR